MPLLEPAKVKKTMSHTNTFLNIANKFSRKSFHHIKLFSNTTDFLAVTNYLWFYFLSIVRSLPVQAVNMKQY